MPLTCVAHVLLTQEGVVRISFVALQAAMGRQASRRCLRAVANVRSVRPECGVSQRRPRDAQRLLHVRNTAYDHFPDMLRGYALYDKRYRVAHQAAAAQRSIA
eukprot:6192357-Pleurochrysis_carterae.AAC.3